MWAGPFSYACVDLGRTRFLSQCGGNRCDLDRKPPVTSRGFPFSECAERDVARNPEIFRAVTAGLIEDENGVRAGGRSSWRSPRDAAAWLRCCRPAARALRHPARDEAVPRRRLVPWHPGTSGSRSGHCGRASIRVVRALAGMPLRYGRIPDRSRAYSSARRSAALARTAALAPRAAKPPRCREAP